MKHFENKDAASEAGQTSKRGKGKKNEQWEKLGENILSGHADKASAILETLDGMEFINAYTSLIKYFKPTMKAQEIAVKLEDERQKADLSKLSKETLERMKHELEK